MSQQEGLLEEEEVETVECAWCSDRIPTDEANEVNDRNYCDSCYDNHVHRCCDCDDEFDEDDIHTVDGNYYCEDCYYDNVHECAQCGREAHEDTMQSDERTRERYCEDCADRYLVDCDHCGCTVHEYNTYSDSSTCVCNRCYHNHYYTCCSCDEIIYHDNAIMSGGNAYCESCYDEINDEDSDDSDSSVIESYGYKPSPRFHRVSGIDDGGLFLGVEIEMDGGGENSHNAQQLLSIMNPTWRENIYIKHDGSLNGGFEVVSHPATLEYHMGYMKWQDMLQKAVQLGYRSHQVLTCGLHVHMSKDFFGTGYEYDLNLMKFLYLFERFWEQVKKFSRRTDSQITQWAARYGLLEGETPEQLLNKARNDNARYRAINLQNRHTIEVRIFRGTLKYNTFIATLQFVRSMAVYAKRCSIQDVVSTTWEQLVEEFSQYTELTTYLQERELIGGAE
jgi:hypothetical protein